MRRVHIVAVDKRRTRAQPAPMGIGSVLRRERRARGLLQDQLAASAEALKQPDISKWERGKAVVPLEALPLLDEALGEPRGFLLVAAGYVSGVQSVPEAIAMDTTLSPEARRVLSQMHRFYVEGARE